MTYTGIRRQIDREVLRQLPFTHAELFRGQLDKVNAHVVNTLIT